MTMLIANKRLRHSNLLLFKLWKRRNFHVWECAFTILGEIKEDVSPLAEPQYIY